MDMQRDSLQRFLFEHTQVRGQLVHLDASWQAILERHDYPPVVRGLLGEAAVATVLLAATIKFQGSLILQIQGEGPVTLLVVQVTSARTLRGVAEWHGEVQPAPLKDLVRNGRLVITIQPEPSGERYQGIVDLGEGGVAEALEGYFDRSEQLPTRLWLAADQTTSAGLLLQRLPWEREPGGAPLHTDDETWSRLVHLGSTITAAELLELPFRDVVRRLYHEEDVRVFEPEPVSFRCSCSRERIEETLRGLGVDEVRGIVQEQGRVEVTCSFCNQRYEFDPVDAEQIFAAVMAPDVPSTRH